MKTAADNHGGGDAGQQVWIRRRRRYGTAKDEMWDDRDGEMGCKDGNGPGKYRQGATANLRAYHCSVIMGWYKRSAVKTAADDHGGEDAGQQGWIRRWRRCWKTTEEMWDDGDGKMGWKNGDGLGNY